MRKNKERILEEEPILSSSTMIESYANIMNDKEDNRISIENGKIKKFEKNALAANDCDYFIPMSFMNYENTEYITYDCSGYTPLARWNMMQIELILEILERVFVILTHSSEYLILPGRITLSEDTVFYNRENGDVRIAYLPHEGTGPKNNLIAFLKSMERKTSENMRKYITRLINCVEQNNYYSKDMMNIIMEIKRELHETEFHGPEESGVKYAKWFNKE